MDLVLTYQTPFIARKAARVRGSVFVVRTHGARVLLGLIGDWQQCWDRLIEDVDGAVLGSNSALALNDSLCQQSEKAVGNF